MRSLNAILFSATLLSLPACSTLNESVQLGASLGAMTGAAATYTAESSSRDKPKTSNVLTGAAIGTVIGMITSQLVHNKVEEERNLNGSAKTEMYFGDLPPSPFVFPNNRGGR